MLVGGVLVLAPVQSSAAGRPSPACIGVFGPGAAAYEVEIAAATRSVAGIWPVPDSFVKAVIRRESGFRPRAVSPAGAVGLMQIMPWNARRLGITYAELWDPTRNILAGTRLLAVLLRHYQGDVISTLIAYNAGPGRPLAPVPRNGETPGYVRGVLASWRLFHRCQARTGPP